MSDSEIFTVCPSFADWESLWESVPVFSWQRRDLGAFRDLAHFVGGVLSTQGFQLFENGGTPLLLRHTRSYREEILLCPAPKMARRVGLPFAARVHLSSSEISRVRSRFWRPPTRAPQLVAAGDLGQFSASESRFVWFASGELATAQSLANELMRTALPWFGCFKEPGRLRERLYEGTLPWIDECTALELLLAEFDPFEARRYLRRMVRRARPRGVAIEEPSGFDLTGDRLDPITSYYRL